MTIAQFFFLYGIGVVSACVLNFLWELIFKKGPITVGAVVFLAGLSWVMVVLQAIVGISELWSMIKNIDFDWLFDIVIINRRYDG